MKLAKTDYDEVYDDIYGLVTSTIMITEAPTKLASLTIKARAIKELTDEIFCRIMRKIRSQRDRAVAVNSN